MKSQGVTIQMKATKEYFPIKVLKSCLQHEQQYFILSQGQEILWAYIIILSGMNVSLCIKISCVLFILPVILKDT